MEAVGVGTATRVAASTRLPESFTAMFPGMYRHAYRAAFRLLGDRQEAEDVAQEACARACMRWNRVAHEDPTPWVVRVATNLAIDHWRRRQRVAQKRVDNASSDQAFDARRVDLHRALERLTKRQRDVVVLRFVVDLTEAQTAVALGCTQATVKTHAARGLAALRHALGEEETA